jgi:ABC-type sugar transport system substrate-binding protein
MRKTFATAVAVLVAAAAVTAALTPAASGSRKQTKATINIAVFLASAANTYWEAELLGAKQIAAKYPNVKLTVFDAKFTTNVQVSQLRDALVSKKYQAWFIGPNDGGPLTPTIKQAIKQGVKVGCSLVPCGPNIREVHVQIPGQVIFAGLGFYPNGQLLGQGVVKACQGINPCKVLWLPGLPTLPLEVARQDGLYSIIKPHSNIKVIATAAGGYLAAPAFTATQNILRAHPDLNVVVSSGDQMIAGAYKAEQLAGLAGKVANIGNGCTFEAKQLILADKEQACSVYLPISEGRDVVQALVNAVNGSTKTGIYVNPKSPIGRLGTKANIARFTPQFHS